MALRIMLVENGNGKLKMLSEKIERFGFSFETALLVS